MKHLINKLLKQAIVELQTEGQLDTQLQPQIKVEPSKNKDFGDFATNLALVLAKAAGVKPRDMAQLIIARLPACDELAKVEIAGPGFINFYLTAQAIYQVIPQILQAGKDYGRVLTPNGEKLLVEFVSANPTGPLHVGHGRSVVYGAVIADLLAAVGYQVEREYYVNDAGRQMDILAASLWLRYLALFNQSEVSFPANAYQGQYVIDMAETLKTQQADKFFHPWAEVMQQVPAVSPADADEAIKKQAAEAHIDGLIAQAKKLLGSADYQQIVQLALTTVLDEIRADLADFGIHYQHWFSERSLHQANAIEQAIARLKASGHLYQQQGAWWFRVSDFVEDKDRVIVRENGQPTYFAADIAYHLDKFNRGYNRAINVFGADHHGYIPRLTAALKALGVPDNWLEVRTVQFANLYREGELIAMSTRQGEYVTLSQLRQEIGNDATRFFYISRKAEQHMDFDLTLATQQSKDNPVYYVQYAHARVASVFTKLAEQQQDWQISQGLAQLEQLTDPLELQLISQLTRYPDLLQQAAEQTDPHLLAYYLRDLAGDFHTYYNGFRVLADDQALRDARLALSLAVKQVIANGLGLLGVSAPDHM
jgi:arginyl-tRNA synthetase